MRSLLALLAAASVVHAADPVPPLKFDSEERVWKAVEARFEQGPLLKDQPKTAEISMTVRRGDPAHGGSAAVTVDKASGHVVEVTANAGQITDAEVSSFAAFPELRALTLWHNSGGFTGQGLAGLNGLPHLERVTLAGGGLDDSGMKALARLRGLKEFRAWHARFSDDGMAALRGHPALESVTIGPMWEPLLTDRTLEYLADCPKLKKLGLTETWLTWEKGLRHLVKLKGTLQQLDLGNCLIEPAEVERLQAELPQAKITWKPLGSGRDELTKPWVRSKAELWIPKEVLAKAGPSTPAR